MRIIGGEAKKATQKKVRRMKCLFDPKFLDILNKNGRLCDRIQQASRSGHDMVEERQPEEPASASQQMKHEGNYFERVD